MSTFKCKMCGGTMEVQEGTTVCTCDYCGTTQTLSKSRDEIITNLFNRANNLRMKCEFDKAQEVYEKIVENDNTDAEAYWGIVLCKYGIEYVEDPTTYKRVPTCHRTNIESVMVDVDYKSAIENADPLQRSVYKDEAKAIDEIQNGILAISSKEKPFDVFICYKETDENGKRTIDSTIANDIYHQLTQEGFNVFYAAITLEDKLGSAYEPYIFAALNSAKVMLVIGTKPEYFNAAWVKNEWSRYLKIIKNDRSKLLIPCYKDMVAYDLPDEFSHLQAQDMGKIGFVNDLVRGIRKVIPAKKSESQPVVANNTASAANATVASLLKRAYMFLEDGDWKNSREYFDKILDMDPENVEAYLGKLMVDLKIRTIEQFEQNMTPFDDNNNYQKALRFADEKMENQLRKYAQRGRENAEAEKIYTDAVSRMRNSDKYEPYKIRKISSEEYNEVMEQWINEEIKICEESVSNYKETANIFNTIAFWKNSSSLKDECLKKSELCIQKIANLKIQAKACQKEVQRKKVENKKKKEEERRQYIERAYSYAISQKEQARTSSDFEKCAMLFDEILGFENSRELYNECLKTAESIKKSIKKKKTIAITIIVPSVLLIAVSLIVVISIKVSKAKEETRHNSYIEALELMEEGKYREAIDKYAESKGYMYSKDIVDVWREHNSAKYGISEYRAVKINSTGKVVSSGKIYDYEHEIYGWSDIVSIATSMISIAGLKSDGKVVSTHKGEKEVNNWTNIVDIATSDAQVVGLKSDGTVVVTDTKNGGKDATRWENIVDVEVAYDNIVGLKSDGTVVSTYKGAKEVNNWTNIVDIACVNDYVAGLKSDGTVVVCGEARSVGMWGFYDEITFDVSDWTDIIAVYAGKSHFVGLKSDGTVVASGENDDDQCEVSKWTDIVAVYAGDNITFGVKSDGTFVVTGKDYYYDFSEFE